MSNDNPTADHVVIDEEPTGTGPDKPAIEKNLKARSTWIRLVFMLVFCFLGWLATMVATAVVVLGFLWVLFTGKRMSG